MRLFGARRRYKVEVTLPDGTTEELDEVFDTREDADAYGLQWCSNYTAGGEVLHLSAGLDEEDIDGDDDVDFEVIEVDT